MQNRWGDFLKRVTAGLYLAGTASLLVGILLALATRPAEAISLDGQKSTATAGSEGSQPVIPTLTCATHNADGTFTAIFGYENQNSDTVNIPIGDKNFISPAPQVRGQPTEFKPGTVRDAFRVNFTEDQKITWSLTGSDGETRSVTASDSTPHCKSEAPTATPTATATRESEQPTATNTAVEAETATPTQTATAESGSGSPTDTPQPTAPVQATQAASATPRPTRTPTRMSTSIPPNPPTATNTPANTSVVPPATSTPTRTQLPQSSRTPTSTLLPTLPPPTPATSVTPALIPVTGADETHSLPGQPGAFSLVELGIGFLGLGAVVHGLRLKLEDR